MLDVNNKEEKMSDLEERFTTRCPRRLKELPDQWCPLAVMRLKWTRSLGREPTQEEEETANGCPWATQDQMSCSCWFVYEAKFLSESPKTDAEIAALLNLSVETVKKTADSAMEKLQSASFVVEIKKMHNGESVMEDRLGVEDETIHCD